jgi:AcrR family transcriptional regulator
MMAASTSLRDRLLTVTTDLLAEQGVAAVSLREIARRAGVSHGAPLRHFPSLANLLAHVSAAGFRRLRQVIAAGAASAGPAAPDRLAAALRAYCRFGLEQPGLLTLMFRWDLVDLNEPQLAADSHGAFNDLVELVVAAQAQGWHADLEPRRLAGVLWSAAHGLANLWAGDAVQRPTGATTLDELLDPLLTVLVGPELGAGRRSR